MNWLAVSIYWYLVLFIIGLIFVPVTRYIFGTFFYDRGYPFAKTIGILLISYTAFLFGFIKILPFEVYSLLVIAGLWLIINVFLFSKLKRNAGETFHIFQDKKALGFIGIEEALFFLSFIGYMVVRGQEPSIRGLEKFMDFGIINAILRSDYFPPLDMWLSSDPQSPAGYPINYYYFGQLSGAMLIKLTQVMPAMGYNLLLATVFAQGITLGFSLCSNIVYIFKKHFFETDIISKTRLVVYGLFGTFLINLGGNLHSVYAFTSGYDPEKPVPFWQILQTPVELLDPNRAQTYWYPNATRFIPKTIHEFPSYSYVVADLHGHVFDIPFVLLTLGLLMILFVYGMSRYRVYTQEETQNQTDQTGSFLYNIMYRFSRQFLRTLGVHLTAKGVSIQPKFDTLLVALIGSMTAVHYMTNALNGPIYLLLTLVILFVVYKFTYRFFIYVFLLATIFLTVSFPFSINFDPFASSIGVNCAPVFLTDIGRIGPFIFEAGNCQASGLYMLFILWGFFWVGMVLFAASQFAHNKVTKGKYEFTLFNKNIVLHYIDVLTWLLFGFGTFLIMVPEFFYAKDIYPDHFRANTMFKLGYQAFIMMSIAMTVVVFRIRLMTTTRKYILKAIYGFFFFFVLIYPLFAFPSYYPDIFTMKIFEKPVRLNGIEWLQNDPKLSQDLEIIEYFNNEVPGQPNILEAQGDSYTDYNRVSAYTGLPTVAGWWVHEWLWRGSPDVVGNRIPDIEQIYQSESIPLTLQLLQKYNVKYVVISSLEREKYPNINEEKFRDIATEVYRSKNGVGSIYRLN